MKRERCFIKLFGKNEAGFADLPVKISGTSITRLDLGRDAMGCAFCFPHGFETVNNTFFFNKQRSWKKYRKNQWK